MVRSVCSLLIYLILPIQLIHAQVPVRREHRKPTEQLEQLKRRITVNGHPDTLLDRRSEEQFMPWEGKIIRSITIQRIGFETNFYDTTRSVRSRTMARLGNRLHTPTREQMIRDNLFIREGKPLNPYKLADNERYLRDLDFILDANIAVIPRSNSDSVDLVIYTRDVFSIGASLSPRAADRYRMGLYDVNVGGLAQRIELNALYDANRNPQTGWQVLYNKASVAGTLINASASFTQLSNGARLGLEDEYAFFVRLDRPLVSPYTHLTGGLEISENWSENVYGKTADDFRSYRYHVIDAWVGYNLSVRSEGRSRQLIGLRWFDQHFSRRPEQLEEQTNPLYNNQSYWLAEAVFFKQDFYKTRYILGFGRTEDIPYGHKLTLVAGEVRKLRLTRPYVGVELVKSVVRNDGDFLNFTVAGSAFFRNNQPEDVILNAQFSFFSRILSWRNTLIRQSVTASGAALLKQQTLLPLRLRSEFGLPGFPADSLLGSKRLSIQSETLFFSRFSLLGFRFAPLVFAGAGLIGQADEALFRQPVWLNLGGGIRTRNENLVFGTIDLRFYYFPRVVENISPFRISLTSRLQVKYSAGFVNKPALIRYN